METKLKDVQDVRNFWEANPLWEGESRHASGTKEFFEEHRDVVLQDCFAGQLDERMFPKEENKDRVLDLGCGPGLWTIELAQRSARQIYSADLTKRAIELTALRCRTYAVDTELQTENAEKLSFESGFFSHVNCQGVIHHTPNTEACVSEIARVLRPGGSACISVYYKNIFLKSWPLIRGIGKLLKFFGAGLKGRGREDIFSKSDVNEIVRLYDGDENPIGKAYSKKEFVEMLSRHFIVEEVYLHFFPARSLPFRIPHAMHRFLDRKLGFMVFAKLKKPK